MFCEILKDNEFQKFEKNFIVWSPHKKSPGEWPNQMLIIPFIQVTIHTIRGIIFGGSVKVICKYTL